MEDKAVGTKKETLLEKANIIRALVSQIEDKLEPKSGDQGVPETPQPANRLLQVADSLDVSIARLNSIIGKLSLV